MKQEYFDISQRNISGFEKWKAWNFILTKFL